MCGIVAMRANSAMLAMGGPGSSERTIEPTSQHAIGQRMAQALASLRHRGPDGDGIWCSADGRIALGHARLAVIGLRNGQQPMASEDRSVWCVVNGELYGFEAIRRDLTSRGHCFATDTDSEIVVHLYEEHGLDCLRYLRGEFAFVLWDARKRCLIAARDRFGIKPLCYARTPDGLMLASEAKALFALGVPAAWDQTSFLHAMCHQYLPPERTLFAGVSQVPPGHVLISGDQGDIDIRCYWDIDYPLEQSQSQSQFGRQDANEDEHAQALHDALDEAVRLRLRADVPVAFYLSGGIDSASVVALAARAGSRPLHCFSLSFEVQAYDEQALAREMAAHVGAELHLIDIRQEDLVYALPAAVYHSESLAINGQLAAKHLLAREARAAGFTVVLSGEGADEALFGYPHFKRDLACAGAAGAERLARLETENRLLAGIMMPHGPSLPLDAVKNALGWIPSFLMAKAGFGHSLVQLLKPEARATLATWDPFHALMTSIDISGQLVGRHRVEQASYLWTKLALAGYILRAIGDGTEMAHSIEGRTPFLDHHFFELARSLPVQLKIRDDVEKYILRKAMARHLPERILTRPKHPLLAPPITRFDNPLVTSWMHELLRSRALADVPFFDRARVLRFVDGLSSLSDADRAAAEPVLMTVLCACVLQQRFRLS